MGPRYTSRTSGQAISVRVRHCRLQLTHHRPGTRHLAELRSTLDLAPRGSSTVVRAAPGRHEEDGTVGLLTIGAFARAARLTPKALRRYDKVGLLPPAAVDSESGYRFYDPEQLAHAWLIAQLRRIGMPLAEIRTVCDLRPERSAPTGNRPPPTPRPAPTTSPDSSSTCPDRPCRRPLPALLRRPVRRRQPRRSTHRPRRSRRTRADRATPGAACSCCPMAGRCAVTGREPDPGPATSGTGAGHGAGLRRCRGRGIPAGKKDHPPLCIHKHRPVTRPSTSSSRTYDKDQPECPRPAH